MSIMVVMRFGATYRYLRRAKGYSLRVAAGDEVSVQFLSQFERNESQISFERLARLLDNIHVSLSEFVAAPKNDGLNWLDLWAYQLNEAWRRGQSSGLTATIAPPRLRLVVTGINRLTLLGPTAQRAAIAPRELSAIISVLRQTQRPNVFLNLVVTYGALVLPASVRTTLAQQLRDGRPVWEYARYLRAGTTVSALLALGEAAAVAGDVPGATALLTNAQRLIAPTDVYQQLMARVVVAETALVAGNVAAAAAGRSGVLHALQVFNEQQDYHCFSAHMDRMWAAMGGGAHG